MQAAGIQIATNKCINKQTCVHKSKKKYEIFVIDNAVYEADLQIENSIDMIVVWQLPKKNEIR